MAKYHLSSDGTPRVCSAKIKCPLGGDTPHAEFSSPAQARLWAEEEVAKDFVKGPKIPVGFKRPFSESGKIEEEGSYYGGDNSLGDGWSRRWSSEREDGKIIVITENAYPIIHDTEELDTYNDYQGDLEKFYEANPSWDTETQGEPWIINVETYTEISDPLESEEELGETSGRWDQREPAGSLRYFTSYSAANEEAKKLIESTDPNTWILASDISGLEA